MSKRFSTEDIEKALQKHFGYVHLAADSLGCSAKTIYNRLNDVAYLQETLDHIRGKELDQTELKLHQAIMNGEAWAIKFKLQFQGAQRGYVQRNEVTGADSEPITFIIKRIDGKDN